MLPIVERSASRIFFNSTSSIYANETPYSANAQQLLKCSAFMIQAKIFEDKGKHQASATNRDFTAPPDHTDIVPESVFDEESGGDESVRDDLRSGVVPTCLSIYRYMSTLQNSLKFPVECNIMALIYIYRVCGLVTSDFVLDRSNWRMLWTICIILAQKVWDDRPLKLSHFTKILPAFSCAQLKSLELKVLVLLNFSVVVSPTVYAVNYFEMRDMYGQLIGGLHQEWPLKPLSTRDARRLEERSAQATRHFCVKSKKSNDTATSTHGGARSCVPRFHDTLEDLTVCNKARYIIS